MDIGMRLIPGIIIDRDIVHHDTDELVLSIDQGDLSAIANNFLIAYPRHPVIAYMIRWVVDNIANKRYGCNNLDIAGPKAIGRALHSYLMVKGATVTSSKTERSQPLVNTLVDNFAMGNWTLHFRPRNDLQTKLKISQVRRRRTQSSRLQSHRAQTGRAETGPVSGSRTQSSLGQSAHNSRIRSNVKHSRSRSENDEKKKTIRVVKKITPKQNMPAMTTADKEKIDIASEKKTAPLVSDGQMPFPVPDDHMHVRFNYLNKFNQVIDNYKKKLTQNKFKGYQDILYHKRQQDQQREKKETAPARRNRVAYGIFYYFRKVYATDLDAKALSKGMSVDEDPSFFNISQSNQGVYEGSLVQSGDRFWLVMNKTRWAFPNYDTFKAMGMVGCIGCVVKSKAALGLPLGPTFSSKPVEYWSQLNRVMPETIAKELAVQGSVSVPSKQLPSFEIYVKRVILLNIKYSRTTIDSDEMLSILESYDDGRILGS
jgi:hypothetical protein